MILRSGTVMETKKRAKIRAGLPKVRRQKAMEESHIKEMLREITSDITKELRTET